MIEKTAKTCTWKHARINSFPVLQDNELHLWWLPLSLNTAQSELALGLLSDIQRDKYHRRSTNELKQVYLAGRYYLLNLLGAYTQRQPSEVLLSYSRLNKPSLSDASSDLEFNFTDTGGYGVFAFSRGRQVGIDIERLNRQANFEAIVNRRFTEQEREFVYHNGEINNRRCICIWTRKEAFGKATGVGINFQMNKRNLYDAQGNGHEYQFEDSERNSWSCLQLALGEEFVSSVVYEGHEQLTLQTFKSLETFESQI